MIDNKMIDNKMISHDNTLLVDRTRTEAPRGKRDLPTPFVADHARPQDYLMDQGLEDAANTALLLGQPLLLTGEPGTGKSQFAHHLAWQLGLGRPFEFHTKSSSVASDLFYHHDTVRRFHAAHLGASGAGLGDEREYIKFNALGRAVLLSRPGAENAGLCHSDDAELLQGPCRSVVLIDEIDKAPRDFPNDLLHELSAMAFRIAELGISVVAATDFRPIVVVTSNRERPLPDAFLRRCVFYNIEPPSQERLTHILAKRFGHDPDQPPRLLVDGVQFYEKAKMEMARPASISELVGWFRLLSASGADLGQGLASLGATLTRSVSALAKNAEDQDCLRRLVAQSA